MVSSGVGDTTLGCIDSEAGGTGPEADGVGCEAGVEAAEAGEADGEAGIAVGELLGFDERDVPAMAPIRVVVAGTEKQPMLVFPATTSV